MALAGIEGPENRPLRSFEQQGRHQAQGRQQAQLPPVLRLDPHRRPAIPGKVADAVFEIDRLCEQGESRLQRFGPAEDPEVHRIGLKGFACDASQLAPVCGGGLSQSLRQVNLQHLPPFPVSFCFLRR
jgi:hypothetical protein